MNTLRHPLFWLLICLTPIFALVSYWQQDSNQLYSAAKDFPEILHLVDQAYVDDVDMAKLMPGAFQQALEAVDPNASYLPPGEAAEFSDEPLFQRTGLTLAKRSGYSYVVAAAPGSPAFEAGLRAGDYLRQIDGESTYGRSLHAVRKQLSDKGSAIALSVVSAQDTATPRNLELVPGDFNGAPLSQASYDDGLLVIGMPNFPADLDTQLPPIISGKAADKQPIVLDLRHNARGNDADLQRLAALFLPKGKLGDWLAAKDQTLPIGNASRGRFSGRELFLLVDKSTSRAAESFAALAQAHGAATLVGGDTLGLAGHYRFIPLRTGGHVLLSTRHLRLPDGSILSQTGVKPDLAIEETAGEAGLAAALEAVRNLR